MNILFVTHERNLGGASKLLVTLAKELQNRGNKVIVVLPFKNGQVYKKLQELNIPVHNIFFGWWMMPKDWNIFMKLAFRCLYAVKWMAVSRIVKIARQENIDIIHSNSSVIDIGALAAIKAQVLHVWHFREFGDADYNLEFLKGRKKVVSLW